MYTNGEFLLAVSKIYYKQFAGLKFDVKEEKIVCLVRSSCSLQELKIVIQLFCCLMEALRGLMRWKTGHYQRWKEDFSLLQDVGIEFLRYGPPYYKVHLAPCRYDWDFTDDTFNSLKDLNITPIIDLCHFGVPDWIGNFQNPAFPAYFAEYAQAFAERFPYLQLYTPINEIFIAAMFSAAIWMVERTAAIRSSFCDGTQKYF